MMFFRKYTDEDFISGLCSDNLRSIKKWEGIIYDFFIKEAKNIRLINYSEDKFNSIYQDSIQAFMRNIVSGKYKGVSSLKTYFTKIFKNKAIDYDRQKKTLEMSVMPDELYNSLNWDGGIEELFTQDVLTSLLEQLKENCKKIITLFIDGYKDKEIAEIIGKKIEATKKNRQSCHKTYRTLGMRN
jgi:RNA polymerase sigma factor (sigma-70 family)